MSRKVVKAFIRWGGGNSGEYFLHIDKYGRYYVYDSMGEVNYTCGEVFIDTESVDIIEPTLEELEEFMTIRLERVIDRLSLYPTDLSCYLTIEESKAATNIKNKFIEILKEGLL